MKYPRPSPRAVPDLARPDTIPLLTVWPTPKGLPMARTNSPTSTVSLSRKVRYGISLFEWSFKTARSLSLSDKRADAENSRPSFSTTVISVAPHHVVVGYHNAIRTYNHASRGVFPADGLYQNRGKIAKKWIVLKRVCLGLYNAFGVNIHTAGAADF